jgi:hypothetical protein
MAFTKVSSPVSKQGFFAYFASVGNGATANLSLNEVFAPSYVFNVTEIRLALSTALISANTLLVTLSGAQLTSGGSANVFDMRLVSHEMNASQWFLMNTASNPFFMNRNDTLRFSMEMSTVNTCGITVLGWAVTS